MTKKSLVIGVDIGGTKVAAGLVSPTGRIIHELKESVSLGEGPKGLIRQLVEIVRKLQGKSVSRISRVGIGSAGPLHAPSGVLLDPTNFGWKPGKVPLISPLRKALRIPIAFDNDAAAAALAEQWKGKGGNDFVVLTLGTGLGVGVMVNGKTLRGSRGLHPEGGHILLRPGDSSPVCGCGNRGCAEALLSGANFVRRINEQMGTQLTAQEIIRAAEKGDPWALQAFAGYGELLGDYAYNLCMLFYPKQIVLAGSFAEAAPLFLPKAKERLEGLLARQNATLPIVPVLRKSTLDNKSGILGAARLAQLGGDYWLV